MSGHISNRAISGRNRHNRRISPRNISMTLLLSLITFLVVILSTGASAAPVAVMVGPYNVSFDLNAAIPFTLEPQTPTKSIAQGGQSFTTYGLGVIGQNSSIYIYITGYNKVLVTNFEANRKIVWGFLNGSECQDIEITEEIIDGRSASALGAGKLPGDRVIFAASYSPDSVPIEGTYAGSTNCRLLSVFSMADPGWSNQMGNVTRSLLATIHVEVPQV